MISGERENGAGGRLGRAVAHQSRVGARADRKAERTQNDRLAGPGFAGKHRQTRSEGQIKRLDQHHITDAKADQHDCRGPCLESKSVVEKAALLGRLG